MTATEPLLSSKESFSNGKINYGANETCESSSFSSMIDNKAEMKEELSSPESTDGGQAGKTLLEIATVYREQNPDAWAKKCEEKEKKDEEYRDIYQSDSFLDDYYQKIDEVKNEEKRKKELEKLKPPKLILQLLFNLPRPKSEKAPEQSETYESLATNLCIFDREESIFDVFKSEKNEERGLEPELIVAVKKVKYLQNNLRNGQSKYSSSRLKCCLYGDNGKRKEMHKTDYIYVTNDGKARWNQTYVLKGYCQEELKNHHLLFKVTAKSHDDKDIIGENILAGENASIHQYGVDRYPNPGEYELFQKAIENPGKTVNGVVELSTDNRKPLKFNGWQALPFVGNLNEDGQRSPKRGENGFKRAGNSPKKFSGLKRILPRMKSEEGLTSKNHETNKLHIRKPLSYSKSINIRRSSKSKDDADDMLPHVTNIMSRMMLNLPNVNVIADEANNLPPSSNMKVSRTIPKDLCLKEVENLSRRSKTKTPT